ncbi:MAG TPA: DUF429 domain-containing protein [Candidatus Thermoplasmatota archaeon]|nr:DUF429 domain-containing protein [Candidatus Thermoplasmatota archaeon]
MSDAPLVIGVDLAANPENPSWACLLRGRRVEALKPLRLDDELVQLCYRQTPELVALDAPLTPPLGLTGSYSSRLAEKELRAAGFPALPPSRIPTLTFRGMRLAFRLQRHRVIEVFPRATLMRLGHTYGGPKGEASELAACRALLERHLEGVPPVASDHEVDALAAALTAALHLEGRTEALGSSGEGQVWVPTLGEVG